MKDDGIHFLIVIYSIIAISSLALYPTGVMINDEYNSEISFNDYIDCSFYSDIGKKASNLENEEFLKKIANKCRKVKAMKVFEYMTFIFNLVFSLFGILSLIIFEMDKRWIQIIFSSICLVFTFIYTFLNGHVFYNDCPKRISDTSLYNMYTSTQSFSSLELSYGSFIKAGPDGAFAELNQYTGTYSLLFPSEGDTDLCGPFMKYKDLGSKYMSYNKEFISNEYDGANEEYSNCISNDFNSVAKGYLSTKYYYDKYGLRSICNYLYTSGYNYSGNNRYKNLYNRWETSLFLGCHISILHIILFISLCIAKKLD